MEHCVNYARLLKHTEITFKNHSEKVYFFGVIFLCAILPYFMAFASTFLKIFIQCAQKTLYSHKVYFLRMAVLIVYESSVDGKNRKSLRRLIQGTAPPEMKLFSKKQKGSCAGSYLCLYLKAVFKHALGYGLEK